MKKVLILEDEENIRSFVVINLKRAGYSVVEAGTGEEALEKLQKYPDIPTLVANVRINEAADLAPVFESRKNLFMDTSGFMRGLFPVDAAYPYAKGQLVFGSNAPCSEMQCFTFLVEKSALTDNQKAAIYSGEDFAKYITA